MLTGTFNFNDRMDGDSFEVTDFKFFDMDDVAIDMSLVTDARIQFRRGSERGKLMKTVSISGGGMTWQDQSIGHMRLETFVIDWGHCNYYYDLELTYSDGSIKVIKQSTV